MAKQTQNEQEENQAPPDPLDNVLNYIREAIHQHARTVVAALVGVVLVVVGVQVYRSRVETENSAAWNTLASIERDASSSMRQNGPTKDELIKKCERTLKERRGSAATPWILLKLANLRREAGRLKEALSAYRQLKQEFKESNAAEMAGPPLAGTLEEMGRYEKAAKEYEKLAEAGKDPHYYLNAGRCWQRAGAFEKAQKNYRRAKEEAGSDRPDVTELAEFGLNAVARKDKLTVPERPPQVQPPAGMGKGAEPAPGKAGQKNPENQSDQLEKTKKQKRD